MSEINIIMLNRFLDLKNLYVATKIMCLDQILRKILRILSFGGHLGSHLEYFNFPNNANILCGLFFLGCTQNLYLATRLTHVVGGQITKY